jgi:hypothetical protein
MLMFAPPVVSDMLPARPSLKTMSQKHPQGFPTLTWVLPSAGFSMDSETRKVAATITDEFVTSIAAQATLVEGVGFQAAAVRAIIGGIDMMTRSRSPKKVFAEVRPSIDWCLSCCPPRATAAATGAEISATLASLRSSFG